MKEIRRKNTRQRYTKLVSILLAIVLLSESALGSGNIVFASLLNDIDINENADEATINESETISDQTAADDVEVLFELEENREQGSKHFRLSDGSIVAAEYGMDVHYQKNGEWIDIDNRFVYEAPTDNDEMSGFATAEGAVEFKFASDTSEAEIVRAVSDRYSLSYEFVGESASDNAMEITQDVTAGLDEVYLSDSLNTLVEKTDNVPQDVPVTFIKGDVLNLQEASENLAGTIAETSVQELLMDSALENESDSDMFMYQTDVSKDDIVNCMESEETSWVEVHEDASSEDNLTEQMRLENAVTSVGYANILDGISLQYVASGSSLKEYILISHVQDNYEYLFRMNLQNLVPEKKDDGSICLNDPVTEECIYTIPAAYMTDASGAYSESVEMEIQLISEDCYMLMISADKEWINDAERVFPVQIDPTLNRELNVYDNVLGFYLCQDDPSETTTNNGSMYVGYDSSGNGNMRTYIQIKNLPALPKDSVICAAAFNMGVRGYSESSENPTKLHIQAKEITGMNWTTNYAWGNIPTGNIVLDQCTITSDSIGEYVAWDITSLVKNHYEAGNDSSDILAFTLMPHQEMGANPKPPYANTSLYLVPKGAKPILQINYRDTRGVEAYYTYQTQNIGHAGTGYVGDYNLQLTVAKTLAAYSSASMPFDLRIVYNSAYSSGYFTNGGDIHTKDYSKMKVGRGWKLNIQESVTTIDIEDLDDTALYLVYNDADGTEHYFRKQEGSTNIYEDEDGLNLTIEKSGNNFTMRDKKDNVRYFENGYLKYIEDGNKNRINIYYNNAAHEKITYVKVKPNGISTERTIFYLEYNADNCLSSVTTYDLNLQMAKKIYLSYTGSGAYFLSEIRRQSYDSVNKVYSSIVPEAQYLYDSIGHMTKAYDAERQMGVEYQYEQSPTGYFVYIFKSYAATTISGNQVVNAMVKAWPTQLRQTRYRSAGADVQFETADDTVTTYVFNSFGQTINAVTTNDDNDTDQTDYDILGVTAAAYEENSGTNAANNRISNSISSGQAGVNLLVNGGFEGSINSDGVAQGWQHYLHNGNAACRDGSNGKNYSGGQHYNLYNNSTSCISSIYQYVPLVAGEEYTFSAYVNTEDPMNEFAAGGGLYLEVYLPAIGTVAASTILSHKTSTKIEDGWQRLTLSFTSNYTGNCIFYIYWKNAKGLALVDDVQLEKGGAATRFNHVYNGSFESGTSGWTTGGNVAVSSVQKQRGDKSILMTASVPESTLYARQEILLNKSSNTSFLLSAWSIGNSMPDLETEIEGTMDSSVRFWGIKITLKYSEETLSDDVFYLPFSDYATNWQYASMAVTPKSVDKTLASAVIELYYHNNANKAYFDNISFVEEPAQTYKYDSEGNVTDVVTASNGGNGYEYDTEMEDLIGVATAGSGDYTYGYMDPAEGNEHLVTSVTNDTITMTIDYNEQGLAKKSTLENTDEEHPFDKIMTSEASYSSDGRLLSVKDNTGAMTSYGYDVNGRINKVKYADDTDNTAIYSLYDNVWDRETGTYQNGVISVGAQYDAKGYLTKLNRNGYISGNSTAQTQTYNFAYNQVGSNTSISIGTQKIADYTYADDSGSAVGNLEKISYGGASSPVTEVEYTYDTFDRVTEVKYTDSNSGEVTRYGYRYSSDGNLAGILQNGELLYSYDYDSLGRLIHSTTVEDGEILLYTDHQYDTSNRIKEQNWQIGTDGFSESYVYNQADGTLTTMVTDGDTISYSYDGLKRLSGRNSTNLIMNYGYHDITGTDQTTSLIKNIQYKKANGSTLLPTLGYTYDVLGNITKVTSGTTNLAQYTYDSQNQLVSESRSGYLDSYVYDTYGNMRNISRQNLGVGVEESYNFTYGNSNWKDQLTGVSYTSTGGVTTSRTLSYDAIGNPLTYYNGKKNWTFTWKNGKQLATASDGTNTITNTYDVDGKRSSKTVNGVEHKYVVLGEKIVRESYGNVSIDYFYDNDGRPYKMTVDNGTTKYTGYYVLNLQGDVIAIMNSSGSAVVKYTYDAWGNQVSYTASGTNSSILYQYNALKYRGYYQDKDLGMYYLNSRYYDPVICRFISADDVEIIIIEQSNLLQYNLYTYCLNNPVNYCDDSGELAAWVMGAIGNVCMSAITCMLTGEEYTLTDMAFDVMTGAVSGFKNVSMAIISVYTAACSFAASQVRGEELWESCVHALIDGAAVNFSFADVFDDMTGYEDIVKDVADYLIDPYISYVAHGTVDVSKSKDRNSVSILMNDYNNRGKSKSKAPGNRCSTDYFRYLLNGGTPY